MMVHLDEGTVQALLDEELHDPEAELARRHLDECAACCAAYDRARDAAEVISAALALLDVAAKRRRPRLAPPAMLSRRAGWRRGDLARAAGLLLVFAAAASATIPGSPVRSWIVAQFDSNSPIVALQGRSAVAPTAVSAASDIAVDPAVGVEPVNGRLRIILTRPAPELQVRAQVTESPVGWVYLGDESATTRYERRSGSLEVFDAVGDEVRIEIPRQATSASVEIDGRTYLIKEGDLLNLIVAPQDSIAAEVVFKAQQ